MNWSEVIYFIGWGVLTPGLFIGLWRVAVGPTTLDRMVGFDLLTITIVGLMVLFSIQARTTDYIELIILATALTFFSTVAFYYYLSHLPPVEGELHDGEECD